MKPSSIHLVWTLVTAGAFAGGMYLQKSQSPESSKANVAVNKAGASAIQDTATPAASKATADVPDSISGIKEFLARFQNADGSPLSAAQMKEAMSEILTESDPVKSSLMFAMMLDQLTGENAPTVLAEIRARVAGFEGMRYYGLLAYKWGSVDGAGAMAEAATQEGPAKMMTSAAAIAGWAAKDPEAAKAWLAGSKEGNEWEKGIMERGLVSGLARNDPAAAQAYVASIKDEGQRTRMTQVLLEEKLKQGTDAAAAWAAGLTDPQMKRGAFESIADQMYRNDPAKGLEFIKANAGDPEAATAAGNMVRRLSEKDPNEAVTFSQALPEGAVRASSFEQTFRAYGDKDAEAAGIYINTNMKTGSDRDSAIRGLARGLSRSEPEAALTWVDAITDPVVQYDSAQEVLKRSYRSNPEGAVAYMTSKGWTQEQQEAVINQPADQGPGGGGGGPGRFFGGGGFGR